MKPLEAWHVISANLAHLYKMRRAACYKGYVEADTIAEIIAFKALQEMEEREKNEPLKLAELKQMNGEPVWVHNLEVNKSFWMLAYEDVVSNRLGWLDYSGYGQTWIAYRHKQQ